MTKKVNSIQKGKVGERQWRDFLRENGFEARRGKQYNGDEGRDVICEAMPRIHHEVKYQQAVPVKIYQYIEQAANDAKDNLPIVAMRRNHSEWLVVMKAENWIEIIKNSDFVVNKFCPECGGHKLIKKGFTELKRKQRYKCLNNDCGYVFI